MRISNLALRRGPMLLAFVLCAISVVRSQAPKLHEVTLFSRASHHEGTWGKSAYNFYAMARSDNWPGIIKNRAHLIYGTYSFNQDSDWFSVSGGGPELTRIKDLGAKQWKDVSATPFVPVTPHTTSGIRSPRPNELYEETSEGRVTRVVLGHLYVIHIKGDKEDFYVMLRVDELTPSDQCTISWRAVPPPGEAWK
jgi:hypothetical protein